MELALGSWPWSPVLKVNTSWIFVFFCHFQINLFQFHHSNFFPTFLSMRLSQSYAYDRGLCEFTWFNMVLLLFFKNCFFLQFYSSIFVCLVIQIISSLVLLLIFHCFFFVNLFIVVVFFCSYYLNYWLNQWLSSQTFLPYQSFFT